MSGTPRFVTEIDASAIVPTVSNSIAVYSGNFSKGPVDSYLLITSISDLISFYGLPNNLNYSDWYQCCNFLNYGNKLLISRAGNYNGTGTIVSGASVAADVAAGVNAVTLSVGDGALFTTSDWIAFEEDATGGVDLTAVYEIINITTDTLTLDRVLENPIDVTATFDNVYTVEVLTNALFEAVDTAAGAEAVTNDYEYIGSMQPILNAADFEAKEQSLAFTNITDSKLKIIARNPGVWSEDLEIAIATPTAFDASTPSTAFTGIALDDLFEYAPTGTEVGIIIKDGDIIVETWTVDFSSTAKDHNNKSLYVEDVINSSSSYIFVKENTANTDSIKDYCATVNDSVGSTISLVNGKNSSIQGDDLLNAYDLFNNKEELDIDIVIGNELDSGASAKLLVDTRKDCIAFVGANYSDIVGKKSPIAVKNLVTWRKTGALNFNNMFVVACANYKFQYDRYNDKFRWINIAGDIAGLRAQTSMNRASWWASAGLERGQIKNVVKLAFNPTRGQRDLLYKNGLNPIVAFPGQGTVMWGQKTLLDKPSSFDRVNVRGLFNTMERALSKMAKYQVMEFNDNFTRNRIISMIKPYLSSVQAGRGIQAFLVICDESNNTPDIISRNQLVVDIFIQPTYVAEFIQLRFTNAGTNSFSEVIGG